MDWFWIARIRRNLSRMIHREGCYSAFSTATGSLISLFFPKIRAKNSLRGDFDRLSARTYLPLQERQLGNTVDLWLRTNRICFATLEAICARASPGTSRNAQSLQEHDNKHVYIHMG